MNKLPEDSAKRPRRGSWPEFLFCAPGLLLRAIVSLLSWMAVLGWLIWSRREHS
jgi:hypothetical protein